MGVADPDVAERAGFANPSNANRRSWERSGGVGELPAMYGRALEVVASRPGTRTVMTVAGEVDRAYRDLVAHIE